MTLVEVLAVLALMVIVTGLLSEIIMGSLRIFEQTRTEDAMRSDSELAFQSMTSQLREAMTINQIGNGLVDVYLPAKDATGKNIVDFNGANRGRRLKFYRGNSYGTIESSGLYLWEWSQVGAKLPTMRVISSEFSDCAFQALTVSGTTRGMGLTLSYSSIVLGRRTVTASYTQEMTFRNLP